MTLDGSYHILAVIVMEKGKLEQLQLSTGSISIPVAVSTSISMAISMSSIYICICICIYTYVDIYFKSIYLSVHTFSKLMSASHWNLGRELWKGPQTSETPTITWLWLLVGALRLLERVVGPSCPDADRFPKGPSTQIP